MAIGVLFCSAISDLETRIVSNKYTYCLLVLATAKLAVCAINSLWFDMCILISGGLVIFISFLITYFILKRGGGADIKVASSLGLCLGLPNIIFIILVAFVFAIIYLLYRKKHHQISIKETIAYLPFLFIGTVFCYGFLGGIPV